MKRTLTILSESMLRCMDEPTRKSLGKPGRTIAECGKAEETKSERSLHTLICQELNRREIRFIHAAMNRKSTLPVGWPDFTIFLPGCLVFPLPAMTWFVEVKVGANKLQPEQEGCCASLRQAEFRVSIPRSFEAFKHELDGLTKPTGGRPV